MSEQPTPGKDSTRAPRRLIRLTGDEHSEPAEILAEYAPHEVSGARLHADLVKFAGQYPNQFIAAEWQGPLGWTRFLWKKV